MRGKNTQQIIAIEATEHPQARRQASTPKEEKPLLLDGRIASLLVFSAPILSARLPAPARFFRVTAVVIMSCFMSCHVISFRLTACRPLSTISSASWVRSAKALSRTSAAMEGSLSPCSRAVAAPIERPHRAIPDTCPDFRRCSITA